MPYLKTKNSVSKMTSDTDYWGLRISQLPFCLFHHGGESAVPTHPLGAPLAAIDTVT